MLTDLYELTMGQAYFDQGMFEPATFSLFIRKYPANRGYFITAGLEDVLDFLDEFEALDDSVKRIENPNRYTVQIGAALQDLTEQVRKEQHRRQIGPQ